MAISFFEAYLKNNVLTETGFTLSCGDSTFTSSFLFCDSPFPVFEELPRAVSSTSFADDIFNLMGICGVSYLYQDVSWKISCEY